MYKRQNLVTVLEAALKSPLATVPATLFIWVLVLDLVSWCSIFNLTLVKFCLAFMVMILVLVKINFG